MLCFWCALGVDAEGSIRVGRPVIPRPVGGATGDAIELAKADRSKELEDKDEKMKNKKGNFELGDNNRSGMSPSECIVMPLIQSCVFRLRPHIRLM